MFRNEKKANQLAVISFFNTSFEKHPMFLYNLSRKLLILGLNTQLHTQSVR